MMLVAVDHISGISSEDPGFRLSANSIELSAFCTRGVVGYFLLGDSSEIFLPFDVSVPENKQKPDRERGDGENYEHWSVPLFFLERFDAPATIGGLIVFNPAQDGGHDADIVAQSAHVALQGDDGFANPLQVDVVGKGIGHTEPYNAGIALASRFSSQFSVFSGHLSG